MGPYLKILLELLIDKSNIDYNKFSYLSHMFFVQKNHA